MRGVGTSPGIGIGKVFIYKKPKLEIVKREIENPREEILKFNNALDIACMEIDKLYNRTLTNIGEKEAQIFVAHKMMLRDPDFINNIKKEIKRKNVNAEYAVKRIGEDFINTFKNMKDEYLKERAVDIYDISKRVLKILLDINPTGLTSMNEKSIIIAEDLTPSDTAKMNKDMVVGIVTELGGRTSHTSIIAKSLEIPSISGVEDITSMIFHGDNIIIDGSEGDIILNPTDSDNKLYRIKIKEQNEYKRKISSMIREDTISEDGYKVNLLGNIGSTSDLDKVLENGGEGIGLFRTEFVYMNKDRLPTEEEQFNIYKEAAQKLGDKPMVIRTLDVGGDKEIPYLNLPKEMNPFLGYRAIRLCLDRLDIFKTQLRAIYRAGYFGNIKIMFPMISDIEELRDIKLIAKEVRDELRRENINFNKNLEIGIMVEVPAVAIHSKVFAKEVDFFSIGTNDLIQYSLAVDRGNQSLEHLYTPYHPAILRLIKMIIDNGHKAGISVGMCGEVAGDPRLISLLLAMELDEFSMNSASILKARDLIKNTSIKKVKPMIDRILDLPRAKDVEEFIEINILKQK
ncbi:MAG TPA: phosphoenolpyruvate--protein phosphotransferase [Tissierellaceae bacterium]|nr:phosphoenolpyruvate--protein phosphotransferase [Tissierellaceae bacterium]